jgi:hypothetical protein
MAISIVVGYTGIPVFKMICLEDGHTSVSLTANAGECHHEKVTKSCCAPTHIKTEQADECCALNSDFFKLSAQTEIHQIQSTTGHLLTAVVVLFVPFLVNQILPSLSSNTEAPPLFCSKQPAQSKLQVFLI